MTQPALRFTGLRDITVRSIEGELNAIWKEIDHEINIAIKALVENNLSMRSYIETTAIPMPTDYSKFIQIYDSEDNYIGLIPIFS